MLHRKNDCVHPEQFGAIKACAKRLWLAIFFIFVAVTFDCGPAFSQQLVINVASRNGLPPCNLDSFVYQAGAHKEDIYGDEGVNAKPPLAGFTTASRVDAGIMGQNDAGLTTGHGSWMPDAWGADEFLQRPNGEWGQSGARGHTAFDDMDGVAPQAAPDATQTKGMPGSAAGNGLLLLPLLTEGNNQNVVTVGSPLTDLSSYVFTPDPGAGPGPSETF